MAFSFAAGRRSTKPFETTSSTLPQTVPKTYEAMYRTVATERAPPQVALPKLKNPAALERSPLKFSTIEVTPASKRHSSVVKQPFRATMTHMASDKPRFMSPHMAHKNMGALELERNLDKVLNRNKLSPLAAKTHQINFETPQHKNLQKRINPMVGRKEVISNTFNFKDLGAVGK